MSTAASVKAQLKMLLDDANAVTGNNDADLTTAVSALISGFSEGNSEITVGGHNVLFGQTTPDENGEIGVDLGFNITTARFIAIWLDDVSLVSNYADTSIVVSYTTNRHDVSTIVDAVKEGTPVAWRKQNGYINVDRLSYGELLATSQANSAFAEYYVLVPEVYNYMIVY